MIVSALEVNPVRLLYFYNIIYNNDYNYKDKIS